MNYSTNLLSNISLDKIILKNILVIFLIYDFIVKSIITYKGSTYFYNYAILFKVIIILVILRYLKFDKKNLKKAFPFLGLCVAFLVSKIHVFNTLGTNDVLFNGYYFINSAFPLLFFSCFFDYTNREMLSAQIYRFLLFIAASSVFVVVGYVFELNIFETYFRGGRFGYQGLLLYHSEAGYIYFIALNLLYIICKEKPVVINIALLLMLFFTSFLVGTKKTFFLSVIFSIYVIIDRFKYVKLNTLKYIPLLLLPIIIFHKSLINIFEKQFNLFYKIYQQEGFWSSFLSYRNLLFRKNFFPYIEEWSIINFLFGGAFFSERRIEMELFDLFLFFGIMGVICYIFFLKEALKGKTIVSYFIVFSLLLATIISGNLFSSINVMMLLIISLNFIDSKRYIKV